MKIHKQLINKINLNKLTLKQFAIVYKIYILINNEMMLKPSLS